VTSLEIYLKKDVRDCTDPITADKIGFQESNENGNHDNRYSAPGVPTHPAHKYEFIFIRKMEQIS
jgi:hypothetical protein